MGCTARALSNRRLSRLRWRMEILKHVGHDSVTESRVGNKAIDDAGEPRLVVLDDSPDWGNFISSLAMQVGFSASYATSQAGFAGTMEAGPPDVLILDLFMPDKDGIEMIMDLEKWEKRPFIILISGQSSSILASATRFGKCRGLEVVGSLAKPFRLSEMRALLQQTADLVERRRRFGRSVGAAAAAPESPWTARREGAKTNVQRPEPDRRRSSDGDTRGRDRPTEMPPLAPYSSSLRILRDQIAATRTWETINHSMAPINARFCLALWTTQLAALEALNDVPDRLAEATAALTADTCDTTPANGWRRALQINMRTLVGNQEPIRDVASSLHLEEQGESLNRAINRLSTVVAELLAVHGPTHGSHARTPGLYMEIRRENELLKQGLAGLLEGLKRAISRGQNWSAGGPVDRQVIFGDRTANDIIIGFSGTQAVEAGSEDG